MAITRFGLGGPSAAYAGFLAKTALVVVLGTETVIGTHVTSEDVVGTHVTSQDLIGTHVTSEDVIGSVSD